MRIVFALLFIAVVATPASAQGLLLDPGQHGVEGVAGWSFGPSSDGLETRIGASLGGRVDLGVGLNRYTTDFADGSSSTFSEVAPYVRLFAAKEQAGAPVSLALGVQYFADNFEGEDTGWYVMLGPTLYKSFELTDAVALHPFLGFSFVGESYTFGGETDRDGYLARTLGLTTTFAVGASGRSLVRVDVEEHSFRRESYRAARIGFVQRF